MASVRNFSLSLVARCGAMLLPVASCVPHTSSGSARVVTAPSVSPVPPSAATIESFTAAPVAVDAAAVPPGAAPAINAGIPFAAGPNPAASAFFLRAGSAVDRDRSLQCLTEAIYYEAASESDDGQRAVAQVVLNRMRHPAYPASVCGVVYQNAERWLACQFSFACDGARGRVPSIAGWGRARAIAAQALAGRVHAPVGLATHYHTWNVVPFWARKLEKAAVVGAHIFYRLNGALGRGPAFRQRHAGYEPLPVPVHLASAAPLPVEIVAASPVPAPLLKSVFPLPSAEKLTAPEPAPSPIMLAVEGSTVRDEYRASGAIRPEYAEGR